MKYTECRWHQASELPSKEGWYTVVWGAVNSADVQFDGQKWRGDYDVRFWSDTPTRLTQEDTVVERDVRLGLPSERVLTKADKDTELELINMEKNMWKSLAEERWTILGSVIRLKNSYYYQLQDLMDNKG